MSVVSGRSGLREGKKTLFCTVGLLPPLVTLGWVRWSWKGRTERSLEERLTGGRALSLERGERERSVW